MSGVMAARLPSGKLEHSSSWHSPTSRFRLHPRDSLHSATLSKSCRLCKRLADTARPAKGSKRLRAGLRVYATQNRPLSFNQRRQALYSTVADQAKRAQHAISQRVEPLYQFFEGVRQWHQRQQEKEQDRYAEFALEETKRLWYWTEVTRNEWALWARICNFVLDCAITAFWLYATPASLLFSVLLPLGGALFVHGKKAFWSPVFLTWLVVAPKRFPPEIVIARLLHSISGVAYV